MQNIAKILNDYLLQNVLSDYSIVYNDVFPDDEDEAIISRYDPSTANETEYIDGSSIGAVSLSYYVRSQAANTARKVLDNLVEKVDGLSAKDTDGTELRFTADTLPNFVSVDDKNNTVYGISITCRYQRPERN